MLFPNLRVQTRRPTPRSHHRTLLLVQKPSGTGFMFDEADASSNEQVASVLDSLQCLPANVSFQRTYSLVFTMFVSC